MAGVIEDINAANVATAKSILENHLSHLHVLSDTAELTYDSNNNSRLMQGTGARANGGGAPEEPPEEEDSYCDLRGCGRKFPHKHISSEKDESQTTSSLLVSGASGAGMEALDESYFSSL